MLEFRPMGVGEILDDTFKLYRDNLLRFIAIVTVIQVPIMALQTLGTALMPPSEVLVLLLPLLFLPVTIMAQTVCSAALTKSVSESYLGKDATVGQAYQFMLPRILSLVAATVLIIIAVFLGMIFCLVPGILLALLFGLTTQAIIIEDVGPVEGMKRSFQLVRGNLGKVFLVGLVVGLMQAIVMGMFTGTGLAIAHLGGLSSGDPVDPSTAELIIKNGLGTIGQVLAVPIGGAATCLLYYDLRIRKEGFDLEMLAERMGGADMDEGDRIGPDRSEPFA